MRRKGFAECSGWDHWLATAGGIHSSPRSSRMLVRLARIERATYSFGGCIIVNKDGHRVSIAPFMYLTSDPDGYTVATFRDSSGRESNHATKNGISEETR